MTLPLVSIIIPCRNEQSSIQPCIESVLACGYPHDRLEILVVDGLSTDGTPDVVASLSRLHGNIRLLSNPARITPAALNLAIEAARGEFIMRMDAHSLVDPGYIRHCLDAALRFHADNVGGTMLTVPVRPTLSGRAIALALSHPFGVGNSRFRTGTNQPIEVDTVFGGFYLREVFSRLGGFNPRLARSQDLEFNLRLKRAGGRILLVPGVSSRYLARSTFSGYVRQNWENGRWVVLAARNSPCLPLRFRHLLPGLVVLLSLALLALSPISSTARLSLAAASTAYLLLSIAASLHAAFRARDVHAAWLLPFTFPALHFPYGAGTVVELLRATPSWLSSLIVHRRLEVPS